MCVCMCAYYDNVDGVADVSSSDNKQNSYKVYRVVIGLFAAVLDYILCEQIKHLGAAALQWLLDTLSHKRFFCGNSDADGADRRMAFH